MAVLGEPSEAWSEGKVLNCANFGCSLLSRLVLVLLSSWDLLLLYGDSRKAALLGVTEHVEGSSSKSFLPVTAEA